MGSAGMIRHEFLAMGTVCDLTLYGDDRHALSSTIEAAVAEVRRYSRYQPESCLSRIKEIAQRGGVALNEVLLGDAAGSARIERLKDVTWPYRLKAWRRFHGLKRLHELAFADRT